MRSYRHPLVKCMDFYPTHPALIYHCVCYNGSINRHTVYRTVLNFFSLSLLQRKSMWSWRKERRCKRKLTARHYKETAKYALWLHSYAFQNHFFFFLYCSWCHLLQLYESNVWSYDHFQPGVEKKIPLQSFWNPHSINNSGYVRSYLSPCLIFQSCSP